jgi:hypothetical protein
MKYKKCNASDKICRNQNICCTKGCLIGKFDPSHIMENTTKEAQQIKEYLLNESAYHAQMALKYSENEEKQTEHLNKSDENYSLMTWLETRLTQFEDMKTALENITHEAHFLMSHCVDMGFITDDTDGFNDFETALTIATETLASLSETNKKP